MHKKLIKEIIVAIVLGILASLPFDGFWQSLAIGWIMFALTLTTAAINHMQKAIFKREE